MKIYQTRWFEHFAKKNNLSAQSLCAAVREMQAGLYDADLGGGLLKKRIARQGQGKRSTYRTLIATNKSGLWIFVFGFAKSARSTIDKDEEVALKKLADYLLTRTPKELEQALQSKELSEVNCHEKNKISHS